MATTAKLKKNTIITVTFNLNEISEGCNEATTFTDNRGNSTPTSGAKINSEVNKGKKIFWIGDLEGSNSEEDFISILAVAKKDPNQFSLLKKDYYIGKQGIVEARIGQSKDSKIISASTNPANLIGGQIVMAYSITFLIGYTDSSGMNYKMCTIDPKIKMA